MTDEGREKAKGGILQEGKADARLSRKKKSLPWQGPKCVE